MKTFKKFKSTVSRKVLGKVSREDQALRTGLFSLRLIEQMSSLKPNDGLAAEAILADIKKESVKAIKILNKIQKETR